MAEAADSGRYFLAAEAVEAASAAVASVVLAAGDLVVAARAAGGREMEDSHSGLVHHLGKVAYLNGYREFESLILRYGS